MSRPLMLCVPIAALLLAACVENNADSGLILLRNIAPASGCDIAPESTTFLSSGVIQSNSSTGYVFTPVARNDLTLIQGEPASQKIVFIEGARVTIDFYDDDLFTAEEQTTFRTGGVTRFVVPSSGSIDPGGGLTSFRFEIVPADLLAAIDAKLGTAATMSTLLDVNVQLFGAAGGSALSSNNFRYPVEVCASCVVELVGPCATLPSEFVGDQGGACNLFQDGQLDCCTDAVGGLICPARSTTPQT